MGAAGLAAAQGPAADAAAAPRPGGASLIPSGAGRLKDLIARLAATPRRRDFTTVPMILTDADQWDAQAIAEVLAYGGGPKQVWDHTDLAGPWLNLMRNTLNTQIWSFKHPDVLLVSATHGPAHLALFDPATWEKYQLTRLAGDKFKTNTLIETQPGAAANPANFEDPAGVFSPSDNAIPALMQRGVVFMGCHNAIWEVSAAVLKLGMNPDRLSHEALAADLTNHLIDGVVLTPGVVGTVLELQIAGFQYAR
jgi:intracellular sulfur oxidation DsrE/DsrF family protein